MDPKSFRPFCGEEPPPEGLVRSHLDEADPTQVWLGKFEAACAHLHQKHPSEAPYAVVRLLGPSSKNKCPLPGLLVEGGCVDPLGVAAPERGALTVLRVGVGMLPITDRGERATMDDLRAVMLPFLRAKFVKEEGAVLSEAEKRSAAFADDVRKMEAAPRLPRAAGQAAKAAQPATGFAHCLLCAAPDVRGDRPQCAAEPFFGVVGLYGSRNECEAAATAFVERQCATVKCGDRMGNFGEWPFDLLVAPLGAVVPLQVSITSYGAAKHPPVLEAIFRGQGQGAAASEMEGVATITREELDAMTPEERRALSGVDDALGDEYLDAVREQAIARQHEGRAAGGGGSSACTLIEEYDEPSLPERCDEPNVGVKSISRAEYRAIHPDDDDDPDGAEDDHPMADWQTLERPGGNPASLAHTPCE